MNKRIIAALVCCLTVSAALTACGTDTATPGDNSSVSNTENTASDIANFTAPKEGDTIIEMNIKDYGTVKIRLFPEYAEKGVENFVELAKKGYYDGLTFHRVIKDFMIQGGDPLGTGTGGESIWGGKFDGGTDPHLIHAAGALAYANSGSTSTDGSQFYIVTGTTYDEATLASQGITDPAAVKIYQEAGGAPWLDGGYTVFGQVFDGLDIVFKAQHVATGTNDKPVDDLIIESVKVSEYKGEELRWYISDYDYQVPTEPPVENIDYANFTAPEAGETVIDLKVKGKGDIMIKLFPEYADKGVENFVELAKKGYYDGLTFHRIIKDFMIQGGDPKGDGTGGESTWGGEFDGGTDEHLLHAAGAVAYANSGSTATDGSQFYIVTGEKYTESDFAQLNEYGYRFCDNAIDIYGNAGGTPWLDGSYTIFGQVYDGLDIVFDLQNAEVDENDKPKEDVIIESVSVGEYDGRQVRWYLSDYDGASGNTEESTEAADATEETTNTDTETTADEAEPTSVTAPALV